MVFDQALEMAASQTAINEIGSNANKTITANMVLNSSTAAIVKSDSLPKDSADVNDVKNNLRNLGYTL